jgi:hypothetical protein
MFCEKKSRLGKEIVLKIFELSAPDFSGSVCKYRNRVKSGRQMQDSMKILFLGMMGAGVAAYVFSNGNLTSISGLPAGAEINDVAINAAGTGLLGGADRGNYGLCRNRVYE